MERQQQKELVKQQKQVVRKAIILLLVISGFTLSMQAQVTIGSDEGPHKDALLDLKQDAEGNSTKGLVLPRVKLSSSDLPAPLSAHVAGMTVYNTEAKGTGANQVYVGFYYNNGSRWIRLVPENTIFFYAPSIVVPTDITAPEYTAATQAFTLDLYTIYQKQYALSDATSSTKSPAAGTLPVMAKDQLDYFVTYYDKAVFTNVAISNTGVLTYKLATDFVITEKTFLNVVFKIK